MAQSVEETGLCGAWLGSGRAGILVGGVRAGTHQDMRGLQSRLRWEFLTLVWGAAAWNSVLERVECGEEKRLEGGEARAEEDRIECWSIVLFRGN